MFKILVSKQYVNEYYQYINDISKYSESTEEFLYNDGIYAFLTYLDEQISFRFQHYIEVAELIVENEKSFIEIPNFKGSDYNSLVGIVENCFSFFQQSMLQNKIEVIDWLQNKPSRFKNDTFYLIVLEILGVLDEG